MIAGVIVATQICKIRTCHEFPGQDGYEYDFTSFDKKNTPLK